MDDISNFQLSVKSKSQNALGFWVSLGFAGEDEAAFAARPVSQKDFDKVTVGSIFNVYLK